MKYIKTKDGIFRIDNDEISVVNGCQFVSIRGGILHALEIKDKVGDTIEELCDEFVSKNKLLCPKYISPKESLLQSWKNRFEDEIVVKGNNEIYGAIWTDKGLNFVAKMNKEGKLELL